MVRKNGWMVLYVNESVNAKQEKGAKILKEREREKRGRQRERDRRERRGEKGLSDHEVWCEKKMNRMNDPMNREY